tara:strand:+ start:1772 stop:2659 length:888 start_codon:yes stop_codon:yes gene_type:complete
MAIKNPTVLLQGKFLKRFSILLVLCLSVFFNISCSSISSLLFYPKTHYYLQPSQFGLEAEDINIETADKEVLASWFLKSQIKPKGTILFLHGNGGNISTHLKSVAWLPQHGYEVFLLDYRGYGSSTGSSTLSSALLDIEDAHRWLSNRDTKLPLFVFGQSLGGSLAITYTANYNPNLLKIDALISDSAPASWPQVAKEAMRRHWLTWLLQFPASLMPSEYDAEVHIAKITSIPILLMQSKEDRVVGFHHSQQLLETSPANTRWLQTQGGHMAGLSYPDAQNSILIFLNHKGSKPL